MSLGYEWGSGIFFEENRNFASFLFDLEGGFNRSPELSKWVKTKDQFRFELNYRYLVSTEPSLGVFTRAGAAAPLFKGVDVQSSTTTYILTRQDGSTSPFANRSSLRLTDAFKPFQLDQALGAFYRPLDEKKLRLDFELGVAANQTLADGQRRKNDDTSTTEVELTELRDFQQLGAEFTTLATGKLKEEVVRYELSARIFVPLIKGTESSDTRNSLDLLVQKYAAKLEFEVMSWMSLSYEFSAIKEPQLANNFQVSNALLFNFSHAFAALRDKKTES